MALPRGPPKWIVSSLGLFLTILVMAKPVAKISTQSNINTHKRVLTIVVQEMLISPVPDFPRDLAGVVQIHTHALFLRALASEDVGRYWLLDLRLTEEHLLLILRLARFNLDDLAARKHADMLQLDLN